MKRGSIVAVAIVAASFVGTVLSSGLEEVSSVRAGQSGARVSTANGHSPAMVKEATALHGADVDAPAVVAPLAQASVAPAAVGAGAGGGYHEVVQGQEVGDAAFVGEGSYAGGFRDVSPVWDTSAGSQISSSLLVRRRSPLVSLSEAVPRPCRERPWQPRCVRELTTVPDVPTRQPVVVCDVKCQVDEIWTAGGYGWELDYMHAIVDCESKWQPGATGSAGEAGLFQIHPVNWHLFEGGDPWNVENNTRVALRMRSASGWSPWSCSR